MSPTERQHTILEEGRWDAGALLAAPSSVSKLFHDLKSPLVAIEALVRAIRDEARAAGLGDELALIGAEAARLAEQLERLALLLRRRAPNRRPTSLSAFVDGVADRARRTVDRIELMVERCADSSTVAIFDSQQLEAALLELIRNAAEADRLARGRVRLKVAQEAGQSTFAISDEGMGAAKLKRATEPFYTDKEAAGLGLPTAIVLVNGHGGMLDVQSAEGQATTITVAIPVIEPAER